MTELTLTLTDMAHGGLALGRDRGGRAIFVPFAIPGETVRVRAPRPDARFARAELLAVVRPSPDRVNPRCRHFGICGQCAFQHMTYAAQLRAKEAVVRDQLSRVGGIRNPVVRPIIPHPAAYGYRGETALFRAEGGGLGYWSPVERRIFRVAECPILAPALQAALEDLDVDLPDLRKLTLRLGDDDELLAALEVEGVEPPELAVDFPVSVSIVLPDRTAASLIGDPFLVRTVGGRPLRLSPGVAAPHSAAAAEMLTAAVLDAAAVAPGETVLESRAGPGWLTAALAARAAEVIAIEPNPDAVADAAENLDAFDNVSLYEATEEEALPALARTPATAIFHAHGHGQSHGAGELPAATLDWLARAQPGRVVVVAEVGALAKDAKRLAKAGYRPVSFQPVDLGPQGFEVEVVGGWAR